MDARKLRQELNEVRRRSKTHLQPKEVLNMIMDGAGAASLGHILTVNGNTAALQLLSGCLPDLLQCSRDRSKLYHDR